MAKENIIMVLEKIILHARRRSFYCPFCYTFLDADKIIVRETTPITKESGGDPEEYHLSRQEERKLLVEGILEDAKVEDVSFCSIGSGFAGEEFLIKDKVKHLTLIEPNGFAANFLRRKFGVTANIIELAYQNYSPKEMYDVIYTSSLGSWMMSNPFLGVESDLMKFCHSYLKEEGLFISLIYGGLHHPGYLLDKKYYIQNLITSLTNYNFYPLLYGKYNPDAAILVAGKKATVRTENIQKFANEIFVDHDKVTYKKVNHLLNTYNLFIGILWNILFMFKKYLIVTKETIQLISINIKIAQ